MSLLVYILLPYKKKDALGTLKRPSVDYILHMSQKLKGELNLNCPLFCGFLRKFIATFLFYHSIYQCRSFKNVVLRMDETDDSNKQRGIYHAKKSIMRQKIVSCSEKFSIIKILFHLSRVRHDMSSALRLQIVISERFKYSSHRLSN